MHRCVRDLLEAGIPLAVHHSQIEREQTREEHAVLVVKLEHRAPCQSAVLEGHQQRSRLPIPLIPERGGHRNLSHEQQLGRQGDQKEHDQPERGERAFCSAGGSRRLRRLPAEGVDANGDEGDGQQQDENEAGENEGARRDEREAVPEAERISTHAGHAAGREPLGISGHKDS